MVGAASVAATAALVLTACGDGGGVTLTTQAPIDFTAERCLVRIHGKTGTGADPVQHDDFAELSPTGNDALDDGHQWLYAPEERYIEARGIVEDTLTAAGCERAVLNGFSNGAAFVAKLYCRGETFEGRVIGIVVDDPVPDEAVVGCAPAEGVDVALYWTGALTIATAGTDCDSISYTCEGDRLIGIDAYADELGTPAQPSPHDEHLWYRDAPELTAWLLG